MRLHRFWNAARPILLLLMIAPFTGCGGGSGGGSSAGAAGTTGVGLATLQGTVPGTLIEAFDEDGTRYATHSEDNGTPRHPFRLDLPAGKTYRLRMTTREGTPEAVSTWIGVPDDSGRVHVRFRIDRADTIDLGHVPLPLSRREVADRPHHAEDDAEFVLDDPLPVDTVEVDADRHLRHRRHRDGKDSGSADHQADEQISSGSGTGEDHMASRDDDESDMDEDEHDSDDSDGQDHEDETDTDGSDGDTLGGGGTGGGTSGGTAGALRIFGFNDLGMHCADLDYSVFSTLPPFNVVHAQVVEVGSPPRLLDDSTISVRYRAAEDASGSINTTSRNGPVWKTNFWDVNPATGKRYVDDLFGLNPQPDEGLLGQKMPGFAQPFVANDPMDFNVFDPQHDWFAAPGIPLVPVDDAGRVNAYPLMEVQAVDPSTGMVKASSRVVTPVSAESDCQNCHALGEIAADPQRYPDIDFVFPDDINDPNSVLQAAKINILRLHDFKEGTHLDQQRPVLCASCHYSAALDLAGTGPNAKQQGLPTMSEAMHRYHGEQTDPATGLPVFPKNASMEETCYQCHPGNQTQCLRGAMGGAGIQCQDCHGDMLAVGGKYPLKTGGSLDGTNDGKSRRPWIDLPRCQSCHTGDALDHQGNGLRLRVAYDPNDPSASPRLASNKRFAEEAGTLYRDSHGHGGLACEACHGSTHAIWPNANPNANDNVAAIEHQGHAGTLVECTICHTPGSLGLTLDGPHGMHPVNDPTWNHEHEDMVKRAGKDSCRTCHGRNGEGTELSRVAADRDLQTDDHGTIHLAKGTKVSCDLCHENKL